MCEWFKREEAKRFLPREWGFPRRGSVQDVKGREGVRRQGPDRGTSYDETPASVGLTRVGPSKRNLPWPQKDHALYREYAVGREEVEKAFAPPSGLVEGGPRPVSHFRYEKEGRQIKPKVKNETLRLRK